uniref:Uncharacterized protein n=1 Tax=Ditylenchus dipsaci TaxID=166011 RepID=A0A915DWV7_9BILA
MCGGAPSSVSTICLVYVVLADRGDGFHFPIAHALLPNKKRATYDKMWAMIEQQYPNLKPQSFSCDFEINHYKSILATFGSLTADFRSFHLSQNHIKRLKILKLFKLYKRNVDIYHQSRLLLALAYVPVAQVLDFADIVLTMIILPELELLVQWLYSIYVGDHNHPPQFSHHLWNNYERVLRDRQRSKNFNESNNRKLQHLLGNLTHPPLWDFMVKLRLAYASDFNNDYYNWLGNRGRRARHQADIFDLLFYSRYSSF